MSNETLPNAGCSDQNDGATQASLRDAVASALYNVQVQQAREDVADLELPAARIEETLNEVRDCGDDRAAVITLFALVEDLLTSLMKRKMDPKMRGGLDRLFEQHGFLGTASARISLAAALGWISHGTHAELDLLRKMRNEFAHKVRVRRLTDDPVAGWLASMRTSEKEFLPGVEAVVAKDASLNVRPVADYTPRQRLVVRGASVVRNLCFEMPTLPLARQHRVHVAHIFGGCDEMPKAARAALGAIIGSVLPVILTNCPPMGGQEVAPPGHTPHF